MSRWENDDINHLDLPDPTKYNTILIDKFGNETDDANKSVAKIVEVEDPALPKNNYYIKYSRGELVDPHHIEGTRGFNDKRYTFKKVDKDIYALYFRFLKTKNRLYFTQARRLLMRRS